MHTTRSQGLEIVVAPCNQFGQQEPGSPEEITTFANSQEFEGLILAKGDVNGDGTRPLFKYLKEHTSKKHINWNFDGAFLVSRSGFFRRVTYGNVETEVKALLDQEL